MCKRPNHNKGNENVTISQKPVTSEPLQLFCALSFHDWSAGRKAHWQRRDPMPTACHRGANVEEDMLGPKEPN